MCETMKQQYGLVRRPWGVFYLKNKITGQQTSLKTSDRNEAQRLLQARNESECQPHMNLSLARVYLNGADPKLGTRTWQTAAAAHGSKRLKELYRAVVRRLHPDSQREMTAQKTEWWHQAQAAYEAGDVGQLEVILTLCDIGESGTTAHTSASLLQRITAQLKSSLRETKRQLTQHRRDPAWNFSGRTDHALMADQVHRRLFGDLMEMRRRWMETHEMIAKWKTAAERLQPARRRKRRTESTDCPF